MTKNSKASKKRTGAKAHFAKLKTEIQKKLGRVNWNKVGRLALIVLILLASQGTFGPVAAKYAAVIINAATIVA